MKAHAVVHAIVENQLALAEPVVVETFARLGREGLDRHDAVDAIGSVVAGQMHAMLVGDDSEGEPTERCHKALEELAACKWSGLTGSKYHHGTCS